MQKNTPEIMQKNIPNMPAIMNQNKKLPAPSEVQRGRIVIATSTGLLDVAGAGIRVAALKEVDCQDSWLEVVDMNANVICGVRNWAGWSLGTKV